MVFREEDIILNFDLWKPTLWHLKFLDKASQYPHLFEEPLLSEACWRYEQLWMPLVVQHTDELLVAPLDVEFVWICHMLSPQEYENDCKKWYNRVVNHEVLTPEEREKELWSTKELWESVYPDVPFVIHKLKDLDSYRKKSYADSKFSCHLKQSVQHQRLFSYQVSLPHYKDRSFIEESILRYKKYLYLHKMHALRQTPSFDINLVWNVHMLHPLAYKTDTVRLLRSLLDHEVTVSMVTPRSNLYDTEAPVRTLWSDTFLEKYNRSGTSFRGARANKRLQPLTNSDQLLYSTIKATMNFTSLKITGLQNDKSTVSICLTVKTRHRYQYGEFELDDKLFSLKGSQREWKAQSLGRFNIDSVFQSFLSICLKEKTKSRFLTPTSKILGENRTYSLDKVLKTLNDDSKTPFSIDIPLSKTKDIAVNLTGTISVPKCGMSVFFLKKGSYHHNLNPDSQEQLWGPVPLPYVKPRTKTNCVVATHRLQNHDSDARPIFSVRIIHSLPLMMSAVQIYHKEKIAVISHLIGRDQLPVPSSVAQKMRCITLDPSKQERAMLIKNHKGDWAICVGRWEGEGEGYLRVKFYKAPFHGEREVISLESAFLWKKDYEVKVRNMTMHFDRGTMEIYETTDDVAEHLALAFTIAVLQTLCQPRSKGWKPITKRESKPVKVEGNSVCNMGLILAAGFSVLTPSNSFMANNKKLESLTSIDEGDEEKMSDDEECLESPWSDPKDDEQGSPDALYANLLDSVKKDSDTSTSDSDLLNGSDDTNVLSDDTHVVSDDNTDIQNAGDRGPVSIDMVDGDVVNEDDKVMEEEVIIIENYDRPNSSNEILTIDKFDQPPSRNESPCFRDADSPDMRNESPRFFIDNFTREPDEIEQETHVASVHENYREDDNAFSDFADGYRNTGSRYSERRDSSSFVGGGFGDNALGFGSVSSSGSLGAFGDNTRGFGDSAGSYGDNRDGLGDGFI